MEAAGVEVDLIRGGDSDHDQPLAESQLLEALDE